MKRTLRIFIPIILIAGICALTCPNTQKHSEAIKEGFTNHFNKEMSVNGADDPDSEFMQLGAQFGVGMMNMYLESNLKVKSYGVCSVGKIERKKKSTTVSVGVLGHVFTVPFEKIQKQMFGF